MAVGVSLNVTDVAEFRAQFAKAIAAQKAAGVAMADGRDLEIVHWIKATDVTDRVLDDLELLQPYGEANAEPIFGVRGFIFDKAPQVFGDGNFRFQFNISGSRKINFIAWRMATRLPEVGRAVDLAVKLQWNRWQGRKLPQVEILDWRYAG